MGTVNESKPAAASGFPAALAFGVLWGSAEATLGHLLHLARIPGLAGFVMFPVALFFLARAYGSTGRLSVLPAAAAVAAAVKLVDAFLPGADLWAALNPAQAIFLEGLAVTALFGVSGKPVRLRPIPVALTALSWRFVFLLAGRGESALPGASNAWTSGFAFRLDFLLVGTAAQTAAILLLASLIFSRSGSLAAPVLRPRPAAVAILGAAALIVEALL